MRLSKPKKSPKNKQQRINVRANKILISEYQKRGITSCEFKGENCKGDWNMSFHHRFSRWYYRSQPELLADFNETLLLCCQCHSLLQRDNKLSNEIFLRLRPKI